MTRFLSFVTISSLPTVLKENEWQEKMLLVAIMSRCSLYFSIMFVTGSALIPIDAVEPSSDVIFMFTTISAKKLQFCLKEQVS